MFGGGGDGRMMEQIFNLKFTSKQLVRQSVKCEREEKEEKLKARAGHLQAPGLWLRVVLSHAAPCR